jgi:hypothetical protein
VLKKELGMPLKPDLDFEEFALDCIRLAGQERYPRLRGRLLMLAREWMHASMHHQGADINRNGEQMDVNSGEPWLEMDIDDLKYSLDYGKTFADTASFLCRDEDEVREKARALGF